MKKGIISIVAPVWMLVYTLAIQGTIYNQVASFEDLAQAVFPTSPGTPTSIGGVAVSPDGKTAYAILRRASPYSWIVKIDNFAQPNQSIHMFYDWGASYLNSLQAFYVHDNDLIIGDITSDAIYKINRTTSELSTYISKAQLAAQSGTSSPNIQANQSGLTNTGELAFYQLSGTAPAFYVTTGPGTIEYLMPLALQNTTTISSAITYDVFGNAYWGNNTTASILRYDGQTLTDVVGPANIQAATGTAEAGFSAFRYNPADGKIYFRDGVSSHFLKADPVTSIVEIVLTNSELTAGPAQNNTTIGPFNYVQGKLVWANTTQGIFIVPEPLTVMLLAFGTLACFRRRG